jgi:SAM-dependent methyltransferase
MTALVESLDRSHWFEALDRSSSSAIRAKRDFIADGRRANWIFDLALPAHSRALDVGCGMGSIAAALAAHVDEVVAVESVDLRAQFCARRFEQDRLPVTVMRADALRLPFASQSFDLIVLNGVLEWLGKGQGGDPRRVQRDALVRLRALLRPGGHLVVAIENRTAVGYFRGRIDHSYVPYTSLMPRWLADRVMRARRGEPYDTYTYTHRGYQRLFRDAGFSAVRTLLPIWGYNRPDYLVPVDPVVGRHMARTLERGGGRAARRPLLRRLDRRLRMSPRFAEDFVFLVTAGRQRGTSWLRHHLAQKWQSWGLKGDPNRLELVIQNRSVPSVLAFGGDDPYPAVVVKLSPFVSESEFSPAAAELGALRQLHETLPPALSASLPRPLDLARVGHHELGVITHLRGRRAVLAGGGPESPATLASAARLAERGLAWLESFQKATGTGTALLERAELEAVITGAGPRLGAAGAALEAELRAKLAVGWPHAGFEVLRYPQHGDYAVSHLIELEGPEPILGIIDWERFGRVSMPGFDTLHFGAYLMLLTISTERAWRPEAAVEAMLRHGPARDAIRRPMERSLAFLGIDPDVLPILLAVYYLAYAREYGGHRERRRMMELLLAQLRELVARL